jgi:hypothetical protein
MNPGQDTLFDVAPTRPVPEPFGTFLEGIAARDAFGDNPTAAQRRAARKTAERMAVELAALRSTNPPTV